MNIDSEYSRDFFAAYIDGLGTMFDEKNAGKPCNEGRMLPEIPKARML